MRRIGHRGAMGHAPENTIASFQKALDLACDEIETDVWLTQDGRLLVTHDRPTAKSTLSLDEVLDFCRGRLGVNVELKCEKDEARARETGAAVGGRLAARGRGDYYVSSFWWSALEGARSAAPAIRRAFIFSGSPDRAALLASARALELWALHPERTYVTQDLIRAAHAASLRVNAWTVNEPKEITTFRNWSVDGIVSDFPERVPKD
jgi:glycerophosphoryl diester phosphodiesterase